MVVVPFLFAFGGECGQKTAEERAGLPILTSPKSIAEDMESKATTAE